MHSKIFQVSKNPINKEEYATPEMYYNNSQDFADYIGDEVDNPEERKEYIEYLSEVLDDIFDLEGETLVYKGLDKFLSDWVKDIKELANNFNEQNISEAPNLWKLKSIIERTHLDCYFRFDIHDWADGIADSLKSLIVYAKSQMQPGDRLYVGSIIDYHV